MPTYDYRCTANGEVFEVRHGMQERLKTWGELCATVGMAPGDVPEDAPVERLMRGGNIIQSSALKSGEAPACNTGACCPSGMCGL